MNFGVIDVETCEPIPNVLVDIWHANSTGYYAGFNEDQADEILSDRGRIPLYLRKWGETFLRGAYPTDKNGVAQLTTIFPGYYVGRATHVHVKVYPKWKLLDNGTFIGENLVHKGQIFVSDDLNMAIDKLWPYNTNPVAQTYGRVRNWDDFADLYKKAHAGGYNSTFDTHLLGGVLQQGVIGYITLVVNMSATVDDVWNVLNPMA